MSRGVERMYCEKCGKKLDDNALKCNFCGEPIKSYNGTCFTDEDYTTFKIFGILSALAAIGMMIILYIAITKNGYYTDTVEENSTNNSAVSTTDANTDYMDKYEDEVILVINNEIQHGYSREEKINYIEDFLSSALYRDWYPTKYSDEFYNISESDFMGNKYIIKSFSCYSYLEYADLQVILEDGTSLNVNVQNDIYSNYTSERVGYLKVENALGENDTLEFYTMKHESINDLEICRMADENGKKYIEDSGNKDDYDSNDDSNDYEYDYENDYKDGEYIFPNSDTEYLSDDDVSDLSKEELRLARNEIFARYGYVFQADDLQEYFENKSWYSPDYSGNISEDMLNDYEKANVALIKSYE